MVSTLSGFVLCKFTGKDVHLLVGIHGMINYESQGI